MVVGGGWVVGGVQTHFSDQPKSQADQYLYDHLYENLYINLHMVRNGQEQHSIMNFAVIFLKMLVLYELWRAQFLTELHAVFSVHLIWILLPQ